MDEWMNTYTSPVFKHFYKLRDWVDESKLEDAALCMNPAAVPYLEARPEKINWLCLCENPAAMHIIEANMDKIRPSYLSANPAAMHIIVANPREIAWANLCRNPSPDAVNLLKRRADGYAICHGFLCLNTNPAALRILEENPDKIHWPFLLKNPAPAAMRIIEANPHKIDFRYLSENPAPAAIRLLLANPRKILYAHLSSNSAPAAIELLSSAATTAATATSQDLNYARLSMNPGIFTYDYARMRAARSALNAEFVAWWWSPARVAAFLSAPDGDIERLDEMMYVVSNEE